MIQLHNASKVFRTENIETRALNNVNLEISKGEFIAIMGPSGCGKSTLLNIIGMIDSPSHGQYMFGNNDIAQHSEGQLATLRKEHVGIIFQNFNLIDELSVYENIELALIYQKISRAERREKVNKVMDQVGIAHRAEHLPNQLSGGQQQRVAVARALVNEPSILLADEPTGNLDSEHGADIMNMLKALNNDGTTILMVTHSQYHADFAQKTVRIFDGKIINESITPA